MINWRIWYVNDLIIDGATAEDWVSAPDEGVLAIAVHYGNDVYGRKLGEYLSGSDWYWMFENKIYHNCDSTWERDSWLPNPAPVGSVSKKGKWTDDVILDRVLQQQVEWLR